uniref:Ion-translocating oxidoreductase complex subunit G n=1 Tax=candidate division WOR-3 bacterium TaxID=2052148 RepID=A0A7C2P8L1_UNCW3
MNKEFKMVLVLTLVILFAGGVLAFTYVATQKDIESNLENTKKRALLTVVSGTSKYEEVKIDEHTTIFVAKDEQNNVIGYGVMIEGGGFQGPIKVMVGFSSDGSEVRGLEIMENVETPGLGNRIEEDWFKKQFTGRIPPIEVLKGKEPENRSQIQAITGATISSKSVANIVNNAAQVLNKYLSGGDASGVEDALLRGFSNSFPDYQLKKAGAYYLIKSKDDKLVGYGLSSKSLGYSDTITIFLAVDKDLKKILGVIPLSGEVMSERTRFEGFFRSLSNKDLPLRLGDFDVVSGATITQDAVISAVNKGLEILKKEIK